MYKKLFLYSNGEVLMDITQFSHKIHAIKKKVRKYNPENNYNVICLLLLDKDGSHILSKVKTNPQFYLTALRHQMELI
jgi:hypothetical protein